MYCGEYNVYAPDGQTMSYIVDENGELNKSFKILDHLGNVRMTLNEDGTITSNNIYEPFGKQIPLMDGTNSRLSFISKEKDIESSLGDFGVRKYDEEIGRFTSIDPLWEKYLGYSPYHYCGNNPVMGKDPSGMVITKTSSFTSGEYNSTFNSLFSNNSVFQQLLIPFFFVGKDMNYKYVSASDMPRDKSQNPATTENYAGRDGETITKSNMYFNSDIAEGTFAAKLTELGKVQILLHEAVHPNTKYSEIDDSHNSYIDMHYNTIVQGLVEYRDDNGLSFSNAQLNAVAWIGSQRSNAFRTYIGDNFQTPGLSYQEAYRSWQNFVAPLITE